MSAINRSVRVGNTSTNRLKLFFFGFVILFSITSFVYNGLLNIDSWQDYTQWYSAGTAWNQGIDIYNYETYQQMLSPHVQDLDKADVYFYPPALSMLFSLLARLPIERGFILFITAELLGIIALLILLGLIIQRFKPIGWSEIALLAALINTTFARTTFRLSNISLFFGVLILLSFLFYRRKLKTLSGIAVGLLILKPQFLPLYGFYFLVRKSWKTIWISAIVIVILLTVPLLATGRPLAATYQNLFSTLMQYSSVGVNNPSPFILDNHLQNLAPLVHRLFNGMSPTSEFIAAFISVVLVLVSGYLIIRSPETELGALLDFSLISALSLLIVYRRAYDQFLVFPGIVLLYILSTQARSPRIKWIYTALAAGFILVYTLPADLIIQFSYTRPELAGDYFFRLIAPYQAWAGVALFAILFFIKARWQTMHNLDIHSE